MRLRKNSVSLTKFLHEDMDFMKCDFSLSGDRLGRYFFDKSSRTVDLYNIALGDDFASQAPCLTLPAKDWFIFFNYVWRDLHDCGDKPLYVAEWDGVIPDTRYRVVGDHSKKLPDDCVYIFRCDNKKKLREYAWPIPESEHNVYYDLRFLFQWKDVRVLDNIFSCIDKMFNWCDLYDRYKSIKVRLFQPERCVANSMDHPLNPPTYYQH